MVAVPRTARATSAGARLARRLDAESGAVIVGVEGERRGSYPLQATPVRARGSSSKPGEHCARIPLDLGGGPLTSFVQAPESPTKPVLVASDVHLGATRSDQEAAFRRWLEHAAGAASWIILNGDLFDFWFEYRWGVPRGYEPVLAQLREIVTSGVPVTLMGGNHDWWGGSYLREEIGLEFLQEPVERRIAGRRAYLAHGDGLGSGDGGYMLLKRVLRSPITRFGFGLLPVAVGDRIAGRVSRTQDRWERWDAEQKARSAALEAWAVSRLEAQAELELVLLGHTHLPLVREVEPGRWYVNSGDWVQHRSYVSLEEDAPPRLRAWEDDRS